MTELGDRFREFAALCDSHPKFVAAGVIARPNETIVATFVETQERDVEIVARGLYYACAEPPGNPYGEMRYG
jgi:hypothetical protein